MDDTFRITYSSDVPNAWHVMRDDKQRTTAIIMLSPVFRVIFGNPMDPTTSELVISPQEMARKIAQICRIEFLENWVPPKVAS